jgi:hypothetical protein
VGEGSRNRSCTGGCDVTRCHDNYHAAGVSVGRKNAFVVPLVAEQGRHIQIRGHGHSTRTTSSPIRIISDETVRRLAPSCER